MGQISDKIIGSMSTSEERVPYDEEVNNGLIFGDRYIPEELLSDIFCYYVDYKSLTACQLVCKTWQSLIQNYAWRKKAELTVHHALPSDENAPWTMYYLICHKMPFYKNLVKNHSGEIKLKKDTNWLIRAEGGDGWKIECPPAGVPLLPDDPILNGKQNCFVTSYGKCWKQQTINLVDEGLSEYLLDNLQPTIKVSEWYSSRWDCSAVYVCTVELLQETEEFGNNVILDSYNHSKMMKDEDQNKWVRFEHEFKNYGKGLRKIRFAHGGQDSKFWAGHYGSKMAGACVIIEVPEFHHDNERSTDSTSTTVHDDSETQTTLNNFKPSAQESNRQQSYLNHNRKAGKTKRTNSAI